jgi:hypothetical protein
MGASLFGEKDTAVVCVCAKGRSKRLLFSKKEDASLPFLVFCLPFSSRSS